VILALLAKRFLRWLDFGLLGRFHFHWHPKAVISHQKIDGVFYLDDASASRS
jgi:hypothetical protein